MAAKKKTYRDKVLQRMNARMQRDKSAPLKVSKWLKLMDCKKQLFALEDEIDKITRELQARSPKDNK